MAVVNFNYPKFKYTIASTGQPGAGYKLFTYEEGTSTKKTTWTSLAKTAENTNPIVLDANGEADVWIDGNYKFVLAPPTDTDPPTSPVWTQDALRSPADITANETVGSSTPTNGSFETDTDADGEPDSWTTVSYSGGTVELDSASSTHGANSLKFTSTGSGAGATVTDDYYEVEAGEVVGIRFSIISDDADTLNKVQVSWYNASKVFLSTSDAYNEGAANPTTWTRKYTTVTAPATAKYAKITLTGVDPLSTTHSTTYFDNIEMDTTFTGGITASVAEINLLDGVTSTTAELNILDGVTSTAAELNILDGATLSTTELNYVDGVTSAIQTQIDSKAANTTSAILGLTAAAAVGAVGSYAFLADRTDTAVTLVAGGTVSGANLVYSGVSYDSGTGEYAFINDLASGNPSGTWRLMGYGIRSAGATTTRYASLFLRIS